VDQHVIESYRDEQEYFNQQCITGFAPSQDTGSFYHFRANGRKVAVKVEYLRMKGRMMCSGNGEKILLNNKN
jgi:hypothetical protein